MKKCFFAIFLAIFATLQTFSLGVSFQVVQHSEILTNVSDWTYIVEDEILNSFFNSGYIVSNWPAATATSDSEAKKLMKLGMNEAKDGGVDDFVQINLRFKNKTSEVNTIDSVDWKIVSLKNGKTIEEKRKSLDKKESAKEDDIRFFAKNFADYIKKVLK